MKTHPKNQTSGNQIRQPSARCHWSRKKILFTHFDFSIYPSEKNELLYRENLSCYYSESGKVLNQ